MVKWIVLSILLLPLAEIIAFISVAALIGLPYALLLMLGTTLVGFVTLRQAGRGGLSRFRVTMADAGMAGFQANAGGFLKVLAGLLLLLPGFLTDLVGAALLIGPVRRWCGRAFRNSIRRGQPGESSTVELKPGEWRQVPERELPDPELQDRTRGD